MNQVSQFGRSYTLVSEESYNLVMNNDYIGFAIYQIKAAIPGAIGGALATSGVDVHKERKKSRKDID